LKDLAFHLDGKPPEIAEIVGLAIAAAEFSPVCSGTCDEQLPS